MSTQPHCLRDRIRLLENEIEQMEMRINQIYGLRCPPNERAMCLERELVYLVRSRDELIGRLQYMQAGRRAISDSLLMEQLMNGLNSGLITEDQAHTIIEQDRIRREVADPLMRRNEQRREDGYHYFLNQPEVAALSQHHLQRAYERLMGTPAVKQAACFDCKKTDLENFMTSKQGGYALCPKCFEIREKAGRAKLSEDPLTVRRGKLPKKPHPLDVIQGT